MAIPSGSGTEVLKRSYYNNLSTTDYAIINGTANHIYTVLSVIFSERNNASELLNMFVVIDGGSTDIHLMQAQPIGAYETFVFNDKFILTGTDELKVVTTGSALVDIYCTYIDQDWT